MTKLSFRSPLLAGLPPELVRLVDLLIKLPGLGERTALRYALHLVANPEIAGGIGQALLYLPSLVGTCSRCGHLARTCELCSICADRKRDDGVLFVVATVRDVLAFERVGACRGRYHVLGMLAEPTEGIGAEELAAPIAALRKRLSPGMDLCLAMPPTTAGDMTAMILARAFGDAGVRITKIAQGLSHSRDMADADEVTLARAIGERTQVQ